MPDTWRSIRPLTGTPTVSNGPFVAGPRQAGAFLVSEAGSEAQAIAVASKQAAANYGEQLGFGVEVRPCDTYESYRG